MQVNSVNMMSFQGTSDRKSDKTKGVTAISTGLGAIGGGALGAIVGSEHAEKLVKNTLDTASLSRHPLAGRLTSQEVANLAEDEKKLFLQGESIYRKAVKFAEKCKAKLALKGAGIGALAGALVLGTLAYGISKLCFINKNS